MKNGISPYEISTNVHEFVSNERLRSNFFEVYALIMAHRKMILLIDAGFNYTLSEHLKTTSDYFQCVNNRHLKTSDLFSSGKMTLFVNETKSLFNDITYTVTTFKKYCDKKPNYAYKISTTIFSKVDSTTCN